MQVVINCMHLHFVQKHFQHSDWKALLVKHPTRAIDAVKLVKTNLHQPHKMAHTREKSNKCNVCGKPLDTAIVSRTTPEFTLVKNPTRVIYEAKLLLVKVTWLFIGYFIMNKDHTSATCAARRLSMITHSLCTSEHSQHTLAKNHISVLYAIKHL